MSDKLPYLSNLNQFGGGDQLRGDVSSAPVDISSTHNSIPNKTDKKLNSRKRKSTNKESASAKKRKRGTKVTSKKENTAPDIKVLPVKQSSQQIPKITITNVVDNLKLKKSKLASLQSGTIASAPQTSSSYRISKFRPPLKQISHSVTSEGEGVPNVKKDKTNIRSMFNNNQVKDDSEIKDIYKVEMGSCDRPFVFRFSKATKSSLNSDESLINTITPSMSYSKLDNLVTVENFEMAKSDEYDIAKQKRLNIYKDDNLEIAQDDYDGVISDHATVESSHDEEAVKHSNLELEKNENWEIVEHSNHETAKDDIQDIDNEDIDTEGEGSGQSKVQNKHAEGERISPSTSDSNLENPVTVENLMAKSDEYDIVKKKRLNIFKDDNLEIAQDDLRELMEIDYDGVISYHATAESSHAEEAVKHNLELEKNENREIGEHSNPETAKDDIQDIGNEEIDTEGEGSDQSKVQNQHAEGGGISKRPKKKALRQHSCGICGKRFAYLKNLTKYTEDKHVGKPQYQCEVCMKITATSKALKDHIRRTHETPSLRCNLCPNSTKTYKSVQAHSNHIKIHHTERKCPKCSIICQSKLDYDGHYKKFHNNHGHPKFQCKYCPLILVGKSTLKTHILRQHPQASQEVAATETVTSLDESQMNTGLDKSLVITSSEESQIITGFGESQITADLNESQVTTVSDDSQSHFVILPEGIQLADVNNQVIFVDEHGQQIAPELLL